MSSYRKFTRTDDGGVAEYAVRQEGIRVYLSCKAAGASSGSATTFVPNSEADAREMAANKIRALLRKGYLEGAPIAVSEGDPDVLVATDLSSKYVPVEGLPNTFALALWPGAFVVISKDGLRALRIRMEKLERADMKRLVEYVSLHHDRAFDDELSPKLALPRPLAGFSHLVFFSPDRANAPCRIVGRHEVHRCSRDR